MKDETQVKDEIILVVKEIIADNTSARDIDDIVELDSNDVDHIAEAVADRLYVDGYGDVAEWKKRAEVAEHELEKHKRALRIAAPRLKCYGGWGKGFCSIQGCEYHHCENAEGCVAAHLREASRRIEEEESNGKK